MNYVFMVFVCSFLLGLLYLIWLSNKKFIKNMLEVVESLSVSSEIEISLANELKKQAFKISKINCLLDLLQNGVCNPVVQEIYTIVSNLSDEDFPKNKKDLEKVLQKVSDKQYIKTCDFLKGRIEKSQSDEEKKFFELKLKKIQEIRNLADSISEDSSKEFIQIIINDLAKSVSEFNSEEV